MIRTRTRRRIAVQRNNMTPYLVIVTSLNRVAAWHEIVLMNFLPDKSNGSGSEMIGSGRGVGISSGTNFEHASCLTFHDR